MTNKLAAPIATLRNLYQRPLPSARTGPLYNAFSYPTKISPEAIALFIATHTKPGATVLDSFAGSGSTGLAALLCDRPTDEMRKLAASLGLNPLWGPRRAVLYELGVIGSYAAQVMCNPPDPQQFEREAAALLAEAGAMLAPLLQANDPDGKPGVLRHAIWSDVLSCPSCGHEQTLWDAAVEHSPLRLRAGSEVVTCRKCHTASALDSYARAIETVFDDVLNARVQRRKRVLCRVYGKTGKQKWQRPPTDVDRAVWAAVEQHPVPANVPVAVLNMGDLYRTGYHFGITHLHHLYTRRNLIALAAVLELVEKRPAAIRDALRLLALSYNQSHSTLMTRVVVKDGHSDFVLTGAQSGVLYVSGLPVEKNVVDGLARKVNAFRDSFEMLRGSCSTVTVHNRSSTQMVETDCSVDYVFTDPPFADFIPYAEINQVNELWLGRATDRQNEAVISAAQGKGLDEYAGLMSAVFREVARVLKDDGSATVVFHAAKAKVWAALQGAYQSAGFDVAATSVLDKLQASFKQVVSTVSVKGDPLLLLTKRATAAAKAKKATAGLLEALMKQAKRSGDSTECEPERLYSRYITHCLKHGSAVEYDASTFYQLVRTAAEQ